SARDATRTLALLGVRVRLEGSGFVVAQEPPPGAAIEPGTWARLTLSLNPPDEEPAAPAFAPEAQNR
ncbi:MAG: PASTA domain-containing protein, partial [Acidobacteria bacterium]|nr:PASTA domain-containing protein [Acidobacteriota bacterium]